MIAAITVVICLIVVTAYITTLICNHEFGSEWQIIKYSGGSIEPKDIYICKRCYCKANNKYHYCNNCGARMTNGISRHYYSNEIDLSE